MRIQVVGSGSMWNKYNSACYLIDDKTMVDFPNGASKYLYRLNINPNQINNILITHFHGDHYFDLPFYLMNKSKSKNTKVNIFCYNDGKQKIDCIGNLAFQNSFEDACNSLDIKYNYNDNFIVADYNVEKILVDHGRMKPAFGYMFSKDEIIVGFTGDTCLCLNVEKMAHKCNYLFCDCMFIEGTDKHQGINDLKYLSNKYPKCIFVVSHLEENTREVLKTMNIKNVIIPEDGQVLEV